MDRKKLRQIRDDAAEKLGIVLYKLDELKRLLAGEKQ